METKDAIGSRSYLRKVAPRVSVVILALGFCLLGLVSLINKHQVCAATGITFENVSSIISGTLSCMLGAMFLIASSLRWNRSNMGN
jgi:hypothetical protein